jgi:hypothetical protein
MDHFTVPFMKSLSSSSAQRDAPIRAEWRVAIHADSSELDASETSHVICWPAAWMSNF